MRSGSRPQTSAKTKFDSGKVVVTRGVNHFMADDEKFAAFVFESLRRHLSGDWGELCNEDKEANETALLDGDRLFSAYKSPGLPPIWIITERDRSATTILLPDEY